MKIELFKGDCLIEMQNIPNKSIDAIITDPPYGTTACKWDSVIDFDLMWRQLNRIIKPNGAIVLFGTEPFSSALRMSNIKNYKYDWIWSKSMPSGLGNATYMPMKYHEIVSIFVNKRKPTFNRQMAQRSKIGKQRLKNSGKIFNGIKQGNHTSFTKGIANTYTEYNKNLVNPKTILNFKSVPNCNGTKLHPTQKPVALMEYLIKTYTNKQETVLDFTIGSGTTAVAAIQTGRNYIGIEISEEYCTIAGQRVKNAQLPLF